MCDIHCQNLNGISSQPGAAAERLAFLLAWKVRLLLKSYTFIWNVAIDINHICYWYFINPNHQALNGSRTSLLNVKLKQKTWIFQTLPRRPTRGKATREQSISKSKPVSIRCKNCKCWYLVKPCVASCVLPDPLTRQLVDFHYFPTFHGASDSVISRKLWRATRIQQVLLGKKTCGCDALRCMCTVWSSEASKMILAMIGLYPWDERTSRLLLVSFQKTRRNRDRRHRSNSGGFFWVSLVPKITNEVPVWFIRLEAKHWLIDTNSMTTMTFSWFWQSVIASKMLVSPSQGKEKPETLGHFHWWPFDSPHTFAQQLKHADTKQQFSRENQSNWLLGREYRDQIIFQMTFLSATVPFPWLIVLKWSSDSRKCPRNQQCA